MGEIFLYLSMNEEYKNNIKNSGKQKLNLIKFFKYI